MRNGSEYLIKATGELMMAA